jgi:hypothetical protein
MKRSEAFPNMRTLLRVLKACAGMGLKEWGSRLIKMDIESDFFVDVGLIDMYSN